MPQPRPKKKITRHAATSPQECRNMERKYNWTLLRWEPTGDPILKVNCLFAGETPFPTYHPDN